MKYKLDFGPYLSKQESPSSRKMRKQENVAQSTTEAEFVAAAAAVNQALWMNFFLIDLNMKQNEST